MRKTLLAIWLLAAALVPLIGTAHATPEYATSGTITLNDPDPTYGESVTFTVTIDGKLPARSVALIWLACFDANGVEIHQFGGTPDESFNLWNANPWLGGPADCNAELYYFVYRGHDEIGRVHLGETDFHVSG